MYKLTNKMIQNLEKDLIKFHELFSGGRCQAWQLEELIVRAIRSDHDKADSVFWKGNGHDIGSDIVVNKDVSIQVKSGTIKKNILSLSGHRMGRFDGDLKAITDFINENQYLLVAVPYYSEEDDYGKSHVYQILYLETKLLGLGDYKKWTLDGKQYKAENEYGVRLFLRPSMSWQIWWELPIAQIPNDNKSRLIVIK